MRQRIRFTTWATALACAVGGLCASTAPSASAGDLLSCRGDANVSIQPDPPAATATTYTANVSNYDCPINTAAGITREVSHSRFVTNVACSQSGTAGGVQRSMALDWYDGPMFQGPSTASLTAVDVAWNSTNPRSGRDITITLSGVITTGMFAGAHFIETLIHHMNGIACIPDNVWSGLYESSTLRVVSALSAL